MLKGALKILGGNIISYPFNLAKVFIIAKVLDPGTYGVFSLFTVILSYSLWCEFGILSGMDKIIPYLRGKSDYTELNNIRNAAFTWFIFVYLFLIIVLFFVTFIPGFSFSKEINVGLRLLSVVIFLSVVQNFFLTIARAEKRFGTIGMTNAVFAVSSVLLLLLFFKAPLDRLHATLISFILAYAISLLFCMLRSEFNFKMNLSVSKLKKIIHMGFPIVVIGISFTIFTSIDRWVIVKYLGKSQLGYYAFGMSIANFLFGLMAVFAYVSFPLVRERFAKESDLTKFNPYMHNTMLLMSYIIAFSSSILIATLPFVYKNIFYKYASGLESAYFLIIGIFFISMATIPGNFIVAINKQKVIIFAQAIGIAVLLIADYLVVKLTGSITGVSAVTAGTFFIYSVFVISCSFKYVGDTYAKSFKLILKLLLPFALGLLIVFLLRVVFNSLSAPELFVTLFKVVTLVFFYPLLFYLQNKDMGIFRKTKILLGNNVQPVTENYTPSGLF
ncbi:MAG: oligosaccharide flippase family protein [Candidatus Omnitrophica bacterium]|nr:oligosaccharide flippase family protein [Candidatus Omnitrophota bacterium]